MHAVYRKGLCDTLYYIYSYILFEILLEIVEITDLDLEQYIPLYKEELLPSFASR